MPKEKLTNDYIAKVMSNFVHNAGPNKYLMREVTEDEDRFFLSEYADHETAKIVALKTVDGCTIIYAPDRLLIRNPANFDEDDYLRGLQNEGKK